MRSSAKAAGGGLAGAIFDPALWQDWFHAGAEQLRHSSFWLAVAQIIFVNILLSGDNAVVIAMACRGLPPPQRRWGLVIGAGVAVICGSPSLQSSRSFWRCHI